VVGRAGRASPVCCNPTCFVISSDSVHLMDANAKIMMARVVEWTLLGHDVVLWGHPEFTIADILANESTGFKGAVDVSSFCL